MFPLKVTYGHSSLNWSALAHKIKRFRKTLYSHPKTEISKKFYHHTDISFLHLCFWNNINRHDPLNKKIFYNSSKTGVSMVFNKEKKFKKKFILFPIKIFYLTHLAHPKISYIFFTQFFTLVRKSQSFT